MEEKFEHPNIEAKDAVEVSSRMPHIDKRLLPIAEFIMDYASWNLHKDEWNQPVLEVPLFRVLDALVQKGKPYCEYCREIAEIIVRGAEDFMTRERMKNKI